MFGRILIDILFASSVIATICYFMSYKKIPSLKKIARYSFYLTSIGVIIASAHLMYLIQIHDFQYTYIWNYSSTNLSVYYLVASFYSGQEGSFMLWTLMFSIIGLILLPYTKKKDYESVAMGFYSLIMFFLLLILMVKSPFDYVWESFTDVAKGFTPGEGRGLNPVLENYWITIHPPILFTGYTLMSIPFVFALSALVKKDFFNWLKIAMPWTLVASGILGLGIGLGGFWAYETLGWGGFWGWDPVENSSLLPWLISMALIHTFLVQKNTGGLIKTNFFLAILSFIFVLYATFLTRSGILGDMSVHSFVDPGGFVYAMLLIFMLSFMLIGFIFLIIRSKLINTNNTNFSAKSKETFITMGALLLLVSTIIVFIGTSFPIFLELTGKTKTSVDISFYDIWNLPIAAIFTLLCGFSLFLSWKSVTFGKKIRQAILPAIVSILVVVLFYSLGVSELKHLALGFGSTYCLYVSIYFLLQMAKKSPRSIGSYVSHAGVGLFFLGVIFSGGYTLSDTMMLQEGQSGEAFGYKFTFIGSDRIERDKRDREKYKCNVKIEKNESFSLASPIVYWSDFNRREAAFLEPGIKTYMTKDLYLSPKSLSYHSDMPTIVLKKNETIALPNDSSYKITLTGFDMNHGMAANAENKFIFGSLISIEKDGNIVEDTLYISLDMSSGESKPFWKEIKGSNIKIGFSDFSANTEDMAESMAQFTISREGDEIGSPKEVFVFEVAIKPFINLVWIGALSIVAGFVIAAFKYKNNGKKL